MNITYDMQQLNEIMNDFYSFSKIKIVLYDNEFNTITAVPFEESDFCAAIRKNPEGLCRCDKSSLCALKLCRQKNSLNIYNCHSGLIEAVAPIKLNGVILGYIMLGQILEEKEKNTKRQEFIDYANNLALEDVSDYFDRLTVKTFNEIKSAAKIMESCVCYLLMNEVIKEDSGNIAIALNRYIEENPRENLTVDAICKKFSVSRNMLYRISESFFGMSIAKYIKRKRLEKASELIADGVSVTEAAELTGFCDYCYFGKIFKTEMGVPPSKAHKIVKAAL